MQHEYVTVAPHLGASTKEAQEGVAIEIAEAVVGALRGELSATAVNAHMVPAEVVDVENLKLICTYTPCCKDVDDEMPSGPPITRMFTSSNGQWLAAVNCFGDVYVFNPEIQKQHWFISRLDGASFTAGGFSPRNSNILVISTSSNQVYAFDVDAKQLGEWSIRHTFILPGEVLGLTFPQSLNASSVIFYSARAMCLIDFGIPVDQGGDHDLVTGLDTTLRKSQSLPIFGAVYWHLVWLHVICWSWITAISTAIEQSSY